MHVLISGATATLRTLPATRYGVLITPTSQHNNAWLRGMVAQGRPWAMDNDCFKRLDFHRFTAMLRYRQSVPGCRFVSAPDVVGDGEWTLKRFAAWQPAIKRLGYPVALALQDGMTVEAVPWPQVDAVFLGGTDGYKFSLAARDALREATRRGLWVHLGRIGGKTRYTYFALMDGVRVSSIDSTGFSRAPRAKVREMGPVLEQLALFRV